MVILSLIRVSGPPSRIGFYMKSHRPGFSPLVLLAGFADLGTLGMKSIIQ
jgi:hypothetical protein